MHCRQISILPFVLVGRFKWLFKLTKKRWETYNLLLRISNLKTKKKAIFKVLDIWWNDSFTSFYSLKIQVILRDNTLYLVQWVVSILYMADLSSIPDSSVLSTARSDLRARNQPLALLGMDQKQRLLRVCDTKGRATAWAGCLPFTQLNQIFSPASHNLVPWACLSAGRCGPKLKQRTLIKLLISIKQ